MPGACSRADAWQTGHIRRTPRQSRAAPQRSDLSAGLIALQGEPCVDGMAGGCRELAHGQTHDRLDTYGECRDSHELLCSEVTCRQGSLHYKISPVPFFESLGTERLFLCLCFWAQDVFPLFCSPWVFATFEAFGHRIVFLRFALLENQSTTG